MSDNFWNDETWNEFTEWYQTLPAHPSNAIKEFTRFKSKGKDIPKYLEITYGSEKYITGVKRLSDSHVYNIGDYAEVKTNSGDVTKFFISGFDVEENNNLMVCVKNSSCRFNINMLEPTQKDIPKPEWEILSFIDIKGNIDYIAGRPVNPKWYENDKNWKIHSVKRLSDQVTFTIGDEIKNGKIERFYIVSNHLLIETDRCDCLSLEYQERVKPKEALFTTEKEVVKEYLWQNTTLPVSYKHLINLFTEEEIYPFGNFRNKLKEFFKSKIQ